MWLSSLVAATRLAVFERQSFHPHQRPGSRLVVGKRREELRILDWECSVTVDEWSDDTTSGLNTEGRWSDVQEEDLVGALGRGVSRENGGLDGGTVGNGPIWLDGLVWLLAARYSRFGSGDSQNTFVGVELYVEKGVFPYYPLRLAGKFVLCSRR